MFYLMFHSILQLRILLETYLHIYVSCFLDWASLIGKIIEITFANLVSLRRVPVKYIDL